MVSAVRISCSISAEKTGLHMIVRLDDNAIFSGDPYYAGDLSVAIPDDDGQHQLIFQMSGKTAVHTKVAEDGSIIDDVTVTIANIAFDDIPLGHVMTDKSQYLHDFNGSGTQIVDKFYGTMGCNGSVTLEFTTPIYLWLLENM
jgi:hypothetical protein